MCTISIPLYIGSERYLCTCNNIEDDARNLVFVEHPKTHDEEFVLVSFGQSQLYDN